MSKAVKSVLRERARQEALWGDQSSRHIFEFMSILGEEFGELCEAANETYLTQAPHPEHGGLDKIRKEAVQMAAVALQIVEAVDRRVDEGRL